MYTREETILRMNALGRAERPFFFVISHDLEHNLLFELPETGHERMAAFSLPLGGMGEQGNWPPLPERLRFIPSPCSMARYAASFASVRNHLMRGDSYLLNLCVATPVETNLTLRHLFRFARAPLPDAAGAGRPCSRRAWPRLRLLLSGTVCHGTRAVHFHVSDEGNGSCRHAGSPPLAGDG